MVLNKTVRRRLGLVATACMLSVALPAGAAWAQKSKTKDAPVTETAPASSPQSTFNVDIPTIDAIDSNVDEDTLRAIFSGALVENADALAGLTATSITIPEITMDATTTVDGKTQESSVTFNDLVLSNVADGIAASVTLAGMDLNAGEEGGGEFGTVSAANFDIGGVLGLYGLVNGGGQTELETIYTDFSFEGGSFDGPGASCTIGGMEAAEFKARPLKYSFVDIMTLAQSMETGADPSPQQVGDLMRMYADIFTAFETSPSTFDGFSCDGTDEDGKPFTFALDSATIGAMSPGIYPAISIEGLDVTVGDSDTVQIGNVTIKEMDFSGPIAVVQAAPQAIDEAWFTANIRGLIPAFGGFSFSDIAIDVADAEAPGERVSASIGSYDLALDGYFNGIPTDVVTEAKNIIVDLPADSTDEQIKQLLALGITTVDAGFKIDASWNEAEDTIGLNEISLTGANLATASLSGTLTNASEALFSLDENESMVAAMGLLIRNLKLDVTDAGLSDIIIKSIAAEQSADPATLRPVFAGLAEGTVVGLLAGAAEAQKVGAAVNSFVSGKAKALTIELTAKDAAGLGMADFAAAETDPTVLIGKVNIEATAK